MQYQVVSFNYWGHRQENYSGTDQSAANEAYARYSKCALQGDICIAAILEDGESLEPGKTVDRYFGRFDLESDAWEMLLEKYPVRTSVKHQELLDEQARRLEAHGSSFAKQAVVYR